MLCVWSVFLEVVWLPYQLDNLINSGPLVLNGVSAAPRGISEMFGVFIFVTLIAGALLEGRGDQISCFRWDSFVLHFM